MRTPDDFVDDMLARGRTESQILAVAASTRWSSSLDDIKDYLRLSKKFFKKSKKSERK